MDLESTKRELNIAYDKIEALEITVSNLKKERDERYKIEQVLIAAGFITNEKIGEARDLINALDI